jgi:PAS domain S-box-containing protein
MNLKNKLKLVILFILVISVIFSFAIHLALQNYSIALQKTTLSSKIVLEVFQRKLLGDQYIATHSERAKVQWFAKQNKIRDILNIEKTIARGSEDKAFVEGIERGLSGSETVFKQIVSLYESNPTATVSPALQSHALSLNRQLALKAQETIDPASGFYELNRIQVEQSLQQIIILFSTAASIFFVLLILSFWIIWRSASELEESNDRYNFVAKATNDVIYDWDIITNKLWFSVGMQKLFGYRKDQIVESLEWWDLRLHPRDRDRVDSILKAALAGEDNTFSFEYKFQKADGTYADVIDRALLIRDGNNKAVRYIGVMQDITQRKIFEEALKEKDRQLSDAQRAGNVGSFVWRLQNNSIDISDEIYRLYGVEPGHGKQTVDEFISMVHPDDRKAMTEKMGVLPKSKTPFEHIYRSVWPDGTVHWLKARGRTVFSQDGSPIEVVGTIQDITREKAVDQAKSEFVSLASHQLRTPLSAINWYTEMLIAGDAGELNADQKKFLGEVYAANQRMVDLVNSLLNVSRLELGTFAVEPVETDFVEVAKSVVAELAPQIAAKQMNVETRYDQLPKIMADPKLVRIIFQNFMTNALKYTPEKGKVLFTLTKDPSGQFVQVVVGDTGYGIPKDQQDKIFSKLFRADNVRAKDTEGTGLGLYIIKSIVDEVGGKVSFISEENKGTTFTVLLPIAGMKRRDGTKQLDA